MTYDRYRPDLTGGILRCDEHQEVLELRYSPRYEPSLAGWHKLVGILGVGAREVARDRQVRSTAVESSIRQYYMAPWIDALESLPCRALDLGANPAISFNTLEAYREAEQRFAEAE